MGNFKLTYEKKLSTEWDGNRYILRLSNLLLSKQQPELQNTIQNQGVLLNQQVKFKNWHLLILSQYHIFKYYKISIYSVGRILSSTKIQSFFLFVDRPNPILVFMRGLYSTPHLQRLHKSGTYLSLIQPSYYREREREEIVLISFHETT